MDRERRGLVEGRGRVVWAIVCGAYCVAVITICLIAWWWDIHYDGAGGGSFAAVVPLLFTSPLGLLALVIPTLAYTYGEPSQVVSFSLVYLEILALGLLQGWIVWRGALWLVDAAMDRRERRTSSQTTPS